jgi:hypothetical protein
MAQPEHALQTQVCRFVRDCVAAEHVFLAFDRGRKNSAMQHVREKARGLRAGTADTLLLVKDMPPLWVELKAGTNTPSDLQDQFGDDVTAVGCRWDWTRSVIGYCAILRNAGVPLRPNAALVAAHLDALLAGRQAKSEGLLPKRKRKTSGKPRAVAPTAAGLRMSRTRDILGGLF